MNANWPALDDAELESRQPNPWRPVGLPAASDEALAGLEKPSSEQPGIKAMERAAKLVSQAGATSAAIVNPPLSRDGNDGWDLADAAREGWTEDRVINWLTVQSRSTGSLPADPSVLEKVYHLAQTSRLPVFKLGAILCARKSQLLAWIERQESKATEASSHQM